MKKISWPLCLIILAALAARPIQARAADSPIKRFIDAQTSLVFYGDLSTIDLDQLDAWRQKIMDASGADQARKDQDNQHAQQSLATAKKWIGNFQTAGGKDIYGMISLGGFMQGQIGALIVPLAPGANADALAKVFNPAGNPPPVDQTDPNLAQRQLMLPATAVVGNTLVFGTSSMVIKLQTPSVQPRPDLLDALAAVGDAPVRLALVPSSLKNSPMMAMLAMRRGPGATMPLSEPEWNSVTWTAIGITPPPKAAIRFVCQCKDADSAKALAALMNQKLQDSKNDSHAQQALGDDLDKLIAAVQPTVDGSKVTIDLGSDTMDNVVGPAIGRMMLRNRPQGEQQGVQPGEPAPVPPGGGM